MPLVLDIGQLIAGLVLLYFGAEWLVSGAASLARSFGLRPLIVGLTVVAYGTSSPELVVSISAGLRDQGDIALGNVIGSNIANLGLILAIAALVGVPRIDRALVVRELPVLILATALIPLSLIDGRIGTLEASGMLGLAIGYSTWMILTARVGSVKQAAEIAVDSAHAVGAEPPRTRPRMVALTVFGLGVLIVGGHFLVEGAIGIARVAGLSDRIIGLTIVAIGTSLPELATSLIAAMRGHGEIAVGNVIGSNIFNVLLVLGATGLTGALGGDLAELWPDLIALAGLTVFASLAMAFRRSVSRVDAVVLLLGYVAFLSALALR